MIPSACETPGPLDTAQVDAFVEDGFTILRGCFSRNTARQVREALGRRVRLDFDDPATWSQTSLRLEEQLDEPPFIDALTPRFCAAVDQLAGTGRWLLRREIGWWPITFPGFHRDTHGWHIEGDYPHHVWSPEQAILPLFCFSTIEPAGGGTLLAKRSHHMVADALWDAHPAGRTNRQLLPAIREYLEDRRCDTVEVVATEGDVVLAHPLLLHSPNANRSHRPRVMAQPRYDMREAKRVTGTDLSPVEWVIARGRHDRWLPAPWSTATDRNG